MAIGVLSLNEYTFWQRVRIHAVGLMLFLVGVFLLVAIISYNAADPSFNRATEESVQNITGIAGASMADLLLQVLGMGAVFFVGGLITWGWRLIDGSGITFVAPRILAIVGLLISSSILLGLMPTPESWPFASGLGGAIGAVLVQKITLLMPNWMLGVLAGLLALMCLPFALALTKREGRALIYVVLKLAAYVAVGFNFLRDLWQTEPDATPKKKIRRKPLKAAELDEDDEDEEEDEDDEEEDEAPKPVKVTQRKIEKKVESQEKKQTSLELRPRSANFELPPYNLLSKAAKAKKTVLNEGSLKQNAAMLESVLQDFGVSGSITNIKPGPVVTLYELDPPPGTRSSRVVGLSDDIARSMSAVSARISVIPGKNALGIELPNRSRETVYLREMLESEEFTNTKLALPLALGKDIGGEPIIVDLARMPHLLVAGTTGSGKSVAINTMIMSLVYHLTPEQCRFIMIDPKMLELSIYDNIPHLLAPVVTEPGKAVVALKWTVKEMENRYRLMASLGVRNVEGYNKRIKEAKRSGEVLKRTMQTGFNPEDGKPIYEEQEIEMNPLPFIVVVVDEMADLMLTSGKDIENSIQRLAQMARAAGIHIIMATQRPSVDVITGVIKANFPTRISFQVTSKIDSRTILGEQGAEQLLGQGDMLYMAGGGRISRVHGPFVSDKEVQEVVAHLKAQGEPSYIESVTIDEEAEAALLGEEEEESEEDKLLYEKASAIVMRDRKASTSYIQRHLKIGYNRAARIIEKMEREGLVGSPDHIGRREVLARD